MSSKKRDLYHSSSVFRTLASKTAHGVGHPATFAVALLLVVVWAISGRLFGYSDTWQLVINTGTTIVTFLMVFLIQNTQNRDSHAIHLKLDELILANKHARNRMIALEELDEEELDDLQREFDRLAQEKVAERRSRNSAPPSSGNLTQEQSSDSERTSSSRSGSRVSSRATSRSIGSER
jgi:low affinity Fe/Cu permease